MEGRIRSGGKADKDQGMGRRRRRRRSTTMDGWKVESRMYVKSFDLPEGVSREFAKKLSVFFCLQAEHEVQRK